MKILILGLNYAPEMVGIAVYTTELAETLVSLKVDVRVVAGKPYYPSWSVPQKFRGGWIGRSKENGVDVTRVAHYVPAKPTGLKRILHHASFALSSLVPMVIRARQQRPDIVFAVAPSLIAAPVACLVAGLVGAKSWLHIQDFEVEAAVATRLLGAHASGLAARFEAKILRSFDNVSSISSTMCRKCVQKGVAPERVVEFRNWADITRIHPIDTPSTYRVKWGISTPHVALYSGNIANKQGIEIIIEAARRLQFRTDLTFVICGEGPNRANLEAGARDLPNIIFENLQSKEQLHELLGLASLHLLPQLKDTADLVLPSKLTNMLASGRPIVATAARGTDLATEVDGCGIVTPPGDVTALCDAIEQLVDREDLRIEFGHRARARAEERWRQVSIISRLHEKLLVQVTAAARNRK